MDALALLCTLHAEGPRTLRLLREAGCRDVREFLALDSEVVSALLDVPPAVARRLAREGHHLAGRVGAAFLEPEDGEGGVPDPTGFAPAPAQAFEAPAPEPVHAPALPIETAPVAASSVVPNMVSEPAASAAAAPVVASEPAATHLTRTERQILDKVLQRWREGDGAAALPVSDVQASPEPGPEPVRSQPVRSQPAPEPVCVPPLEIAGVPHASVLALEAAGFKLPQAVADANTMALASAVGCSFGDARRFQFLAARAVAAAPKEPASRSERSAEVSERLIERPPVPVTSVMPVVVSTPENRRQPEPEPVQKPLPAPVVEPVHAQAEKTVLNWDFVKPQAACPESDDDGPQAGGPFA